MSENLHTATNTQTDKKYMTSTALGLNTFLKGLKNSKDKWIAICGNFLQVSSDFLEFVRTYRVGDAIGIEYGY